MKTLDAIDGLDVASPCPASWNAMTGHDRARFCALCEKHVYNIAALTTPEVVALIARTEGDFCGRIYRRRDGKVLTADCPVGARAFSSGRLHRAMTLAVIGLSVITTGAFLKATSDRLPPPSWPPTGPAVSLSDWKDWALNALGLRREPTVTAGMISTRSGGEMISSDQY